MAKLFALAMCGAILAQITFSSNTLQQAEESGKADTYLACGDCR